MKILVTGVAGFIGFHLANSLLKHKHNVIGIDNVNSYYSKKYKEYRIDILKKKKRFKFFKLDLKNKAQLKKLLNKYKPEIIFHLASQPGIMYSFENPKTYILNNITATKNLMEISYENNIKKFYFTSSSSVYGNKLRYPIKETDTLEPLNTYAETKKKCEIMLQNFFGKTNIDLKIFRPFTVYGPYSRPDMIFITYLKKSYENKKFYLFNNGDYIRDFTHIDDLCSILIKFIKVKKIKRNIINICSSNPIKITKIISLIDKYNKKKTSIIKKPYRKGEMKKTYGDNSLLKKHISFQRFMNIEKGVKKTVKWYKDFKDKKILDFRKI